MAIIYNYDPTYHNIFIYDEEPGDLGSRPSNSSFDNIQLIPKRRNTSLNKGDFDISGVNYTFARPFKNNLDDGTKTMLWDENGSRMSLPSASGSAFGDASIRTDYISATLNNTFNNPEGWGGFNTMRSGYPFGFLFSPKHMLVPTKFMTLWFAENKLMLDHPSKPYGSDGTVADKFFFMDNDGVTYEVSVTDSNPDDEIINGIHRIPRKDSLGNLSLDLSQWTVVQFDTELPLHFPKHNIIVSTDEIPDETEVMIVLDNGKAVRGLYKQSEGSFSDFLSNIRTSSILSTEAGTEIVDDGFVFFMTFLSSTPFVYYKTLNGLELTDEDFNNTVENLQGTAYSKLIQFPGFFNAVLGLPGFSTFEIITSPSLLQNLIKRKSGSKSDTFNPPGKNPFYKVTLGVTATNVEGISIHKSSENTVVGDGTRFDYQAITSFTFDVIPLTATEKTTSNQYPNNTEDQMKIYAYGSSGPLEQIREDVTIGSTYSNAMVQVEIDFIPFKKFPSPADFIDFKYQLDLYVGDSVHDSFVGRTDMSVMGDAEREIPHIPRSSLTGRFEEFGSDDSLYPKMYLDYKWIKNLSHGQAGQTLSVRLRYSAIDGSTYDSGIVAIKQIEPEILSVPTFTSFIPENVVDEEGSPSGQIGIPPFTPGEIVQKVDVTFGLGGFSSSPNIFDGDSTTQTGSVCKFYVSKFRDIGNLEFALLDEKYITHDEILNGFTFGVPNQTIFPSGSEPESLVGCQLWVVYELDHPAYVLDTNKVFKPDETPLDGLVDTNAIVSPPYFLFENP